jgi:hypothetical protein
MLANRLQGQNHLQHQALALEGTSMTVQACNLTYSMPSTSSPKVGADEASAQRGGRAKNALMRPLRSGTGEQRTLSSPLRMALR